MAEFADERDCLDCGTCDSCVERAIAYAEEMASAPPVEPRSARTFVADMRRKGASTEEIVRVAELITRTYFEIAAEAIGEEVVWRRFAERWRVITTQRIDGEYTACEVCDGRELADALASLRDESARERAHKALDAYLDTANDRPPNQDAVLMAWGTLEEAIEAVVDAEWTEETR